MDRFNKVFDDQTARQNHLESTDPVAVGRKKWEEIQAQKAAEAEKSGAGAQQAEPSKKAKPVKNDPPKAPAKDDPKLAEKDPPK